MNDLFDVLEICLQELEGGADLETVLARYPDLAGELRPILEASLMARTMAVPAPSTEAVRRGRAKVLQHAAQMREAKLAPRRRMIPIFQRLAISFAMTALFLSSGTGLVSASSTALPGENLYPVKLTWENVRLVFAFDVKHRETLERTFEDERLHEVNELLVEGKKETIQFEGVYMDVNGIIYISGIRVVLLDTSILPIQPLTNGLAVQVTGHTNAQGFVDVESIHLLPAGSVVPTGEPVEIEAEHSNDNFNDNTNTNNVGDGSGESNDNHDTNTNVNDNEQNTNDSGGGSDDSKNNDENDVSDGNVNLNSNDNSNDDDNSGNSHNDNDSSHTDNSNGSND
jgi:hypothetical protein